MKTKLQLPETEASFMYQAADIEMTLAFLDGKYQIEIVDTSGEELPADSKYFMGYLNSFEAACLLFLIGNNDDNDSAVRNDLIVSCYKVLAEFLSIVPNNMRPIP